MKRRLVFIAVCLLLSASAIAIFLSWFDSGQSRQQPSPSDIPSSRNFRSADPETPLDPSIDTILATETAPFRIRLQSVEALDKNLSHNSVHRLLAFLQTPSKSPSYDTTTTGEAVIRNNVLNRLKRQYQQPSALSATLIHIFQDKGSQSLVMRDYALQHLATWHSMLATVSDSRRDNTHADELQSIRDTLWSALEQKESSLKATGLLSLRRITEMSPKPSGTKLEQTALEFARNPRTPPLLRATAIQICADLRLAPMRPVARRLARQAPTLAVRRAAIAALGMIGKDGDMQLLNHLHDSNPGEAGLTSAISHARKALSQSRSP